MAVAVAASNIFECNYSSCLFLQFTIIASYYCYYKKQHLMLSLFGKVQFNVDVDVDVDCQQNTSHVEPTSTVQSLLKLFDF